MDRMSMPQMYFPPNSLWKSLTVQNLNSNTNTRGRDVMAYAATSPPVTFSGIVAAMSQKEIEEYRQLQHPVNYKITAHAPQKANPGDRLSFGSSYYYIDSVDDPGRMGIWVVYYCEERQG